jgi:hypothetical protein
LKACLEILCLIVPSVEEFIEVIEVVVFPSSYILSYIYVCKFCKGGLKAKGFFGKMFSIAKGFFGKMFSIEK